ncbi:MAG: single-stranded DNA-binding protein [Bacteroidales bacterium]|nr:single-stranded DNA-binding protein [Candidatus Egerieousia equi]
MSYNKVLLIGNVGKDPDVRHLESGAVVAQFTLATSERYKDKSGAIQELTEWHNIVCWRQLAEIAEKYISKGTQIFVEGKIRTRNWTDQSGAKRYTTEIYADNIRLLGRKGDGVQPLGSQERRPSPAVQEQAQQQQYGGFQGNTAVSQPMVSSAELSDDSSDDLPF